MRVLYICADGILDNLGQTQILPYIYGLNDKNCRYIIFSFERSDRKKEDFLAQKEILKRRNIEWYHLPFYPKKYNRFLRVFFGSIKINFICKKHNINMVHLRAINAGILFLFSGIKLPYLYDIRAFAGQLVDYGLLRESWFSKFIIFLEKVLINKSAGIVVLDKSGSDYLNSNFNVNVPIETIPTATNIDKFIFNKKKIISNKETIKFVFLGGAQFPYLPKKALTFLKLLLKNKIDCSLDIVNKENHKFIKQLIEEVKFPKDKIRLFSLTPKQVLNSLPSYDCGLVFIENGKWIRMSSPTKIGEYLAAGLHIVGLEGIEVLNRLSKDTKCVDLLPNNFNSKSTDINKLKNIIKKIKDKDRRLNSITIAKKFYDIESAIKKYLYIYKIIINQNK